jgi:hypothetical protein
MFSFSLLIFFARRFERVWTASRTHSAKKMASIYPALQHLSTQFTNFFRFFFDFPPKKLGTTGSNAVIAALKSVKHANYLCSSKLLDY